MSELMERAGDLKGELVAFGCQPKFAVAMEMARENSFGTARQTKQDRADINFLDYFLLQCKLSDGRTVVAHFVDANPRLPAAERKMLLGWQEVVEGIFEIRRNVEGTLLAENLVDELPYFIRSNKGPISPRQMPTGGFLITRIVPVEDEWMLSGASTMLTADQRGDAYHFALALALKSPRLVFRNPEKLAEGWEMQREDRREFIAFFGSDMVTFPVEEIAEQMEAYYHYKMYEVRDENGTTRAERAREKYGTEGKPLQNLVPDLGEDVETVGLLYDETEGLIYYPDFGLLEAAFAAPELAKEEPYRDCLMTYIQSDDISSLPIRRLAERDADRASQVFRHLFRRPRFSWERDGEKFLNRYKLRLLQEPHLPGITPVSERLSAVQLSPTPKSKLPPGAPKPGRNEPCPCGSGQKYKKCCGR